MATGTSAHLAPQRHGGDYTEEFGFALVNLNFLIVTTDGINFEASRGTGPLVTRYTGYEDCLVVVDAQGRSSVDLDHVWCSFLASYLDSAEKAGAMHSG